MSAAAILRHFSNVLSLFFLVKRRPLKCWTRGGGSDSRRPADSIMPFRDLRFLGHFVDCRPIMASETGESTAPWGFSHPHEHCNQSVTRALWAGFF